jgi:hypothetical protein
MKLLVNMVALKKVFRDKQDIASTSWTLGNVSREVMITIASWLGKFILALNRMNNSHFVDSFKVTEHEVKLFALYGRSLYRSYDYSQLS